jgi:hypothetical protein
VVAAAVQAVKAEQAESQEAQEAQEEAVTAQPILYLQPQEQSISAAVVVADVTAQIKETEALAGLELLFYVMQILSQI